MVVKNNRSSGWTMLVALAAVAVVLLSLASFGDATAASRLVKHSNPAATAHQDPMVYYPQGCRCCWFIWKPVIKCGAVCCGDGCTCT